MNFIARLIVRLAPTSLKELMAELSPNISLPAIKDNGQIISGPASIATYLKELEKFVADWQRFQSDSCYIDDQGEAVK